MHSIKGDNYVVTAKNLSFLKTMVQRKASKHKQEKKMNFLELMSIVYHIKGPNDTLEKLKWMCSGMM